MERGSAAETYEHVLTCLICRSVFDEHEHQPKFVPCHHTFCRACLAECVRQCGDEFECPSCRKLAVVPAAGVAALQTNFYVRYVQQLVSGGPGGFVGMGGVAAAECSVHPGASLDVYCHECQTTVCGRCRDRDAHAGHQMSPLSAAVATAQRDLDTAFGAAAGRTARLRAALEATARGFAEEKDTAMMRIEAAAERHAHALARRTTLLKNAAIGIYAEHARMLTSALEEVATATCCLVSLKEHHEEGLRRGDLVSTTLGVSEMHEVACNVCEHVAPPERHIVFEERHGLERFKACVQDLGRVSSRPGERPGGQDVSDSELPTRHNEEVFAAAADHKRGVRPKTLPTVLPRSRSRGNISKPVTRKPGTSPQYDLRCDMAGTERDAANESHEASQEGNGDDQTTIPCHSSLSDADDYTDTDADKAYRQLICTSYDDEQLAENNSR